MHPGEEDEFVFEDGPDDGSEEEEVDHLAELATLGWHRAEASSAEPADAPRAVGEDPVARKLRHEVGIYQGKRWWSDDIGPQPTPLALTAGDLLEAGPPTAEGARPVADSWPSSPEEMSSRLPLAVSSLQDGEQRFWDVGLSAWYAGMHINYPRDKEKVCKPARLHAELWINESTRDEIWAFVALREDWYVPDKALQRAVWGRAVSGRSPFAEPELLPDLLPDVVYLPLEGPPGPDDDPGTAT